jgi:hypothetical protein
LVLPKNHVETLSSLSIWELLELEKFAANVVRHQDHCGKPIFFEHGARCHTGSGCGIYHAHLHIVPVSSPVTCASLLPRGSRPAPSLISALAQLRSEGCDEYLAVTDSHGETRFLSVNDAGDFKPGSQYLRRRLAEVFQLDRSWDWRDYLHPEPDLLQTIDRLTAK